MECVHEYVCLVCVLYIIFIRYSPSRLKTSQNQSTLHTPQSYHLPTYHYPVHSKERQSTYFRRTDLQLRARRSQTRKRGYIERTSSQRKLLPARATGPVPRSRRKYRDPFRPRKGPGFQIPGYFTNNLEAWTENHFFAASPDDH